jgi:hypothetical protein
LSLFACVECNVVENTALCGLVFEDGPQRRRKLVCSRCNPEIGRWHGVFPRVDATGAGYVPVPDSRYIQLPSE